MRVKITERHCDVPDDVIGRAEEQAKSLSKYEPRATATEVVFSEQKNTRQVEVIVHVDGSEAVVAEGDDLEFRPALDQALDRVGRQLKRQRERRRDHKAPPLAEGLGEA